MAAGGTVNVHTSPAIPHRPLVSLRFAPFQDILTIGHAAGLSSILVPGAGELNCDSAEADPFENRKARRERRRDYWIRSNAGHSFCPTYASGALALCLEADLTEEATNDDSGEGEGDADGRPNGKPLSREEREKREMRGKRKSLKRYLRKQRKNVIDPAAVAIRAKQREERRLAEAGVEGQETVGFRTAQEGWVMCEV